MRLEGKVAIVTGGGSGIGRATAEVFAREAAKVIICDNNTKVGQETVLSIEKNGGKARFVYADVSQERDIKDMIAETIKAYKKIDILVNNAASFVLKGFDASVAEFKRSFAVNVLGAILASKYASKYMKGGGTIINLGSISSFVAQPGLFAYSITKAAVLQLTRNMAMDLGPQRIRVNCICPGPVLTDALLNKYEGEGLDEINAKEGSLTILRRVAQPVEIANAILFLATDDASYITGASIAVDGGYTAL